MTSFQTKIKAIRSRLQDELGIDQLKIELDKVEDKQSSLEEEISNLCIVLPATFTFRLYKYGHTAEECIQVDLLNDTPSVSELFGHDQDDIPTKALELGKQYAELVKEETLLSRRIRSRDIEKVTMTKVLQLWAFLKMSEDEDIEVAYQKIKQELTK